jgi:uncharacterized radical SAM superfamily Fe-S cluster-containing enzyme
MGELEARPKRRLGMLPVVVPLTRRERIAAITRVLMGLDAEGTIAHVGAREVQKPLKSTVSLCASCLAYVPALVFERSGRVLMAKRCSEHGASEVLVERDARYYHLSNKDKSGKRFAKDAPFHIPTLPGFVSGALSEGGECCAPGETCGPTDGTSQLENRTCTVLVEVTDACNLACKVCYSDSKGDRFLPFATFKRHLLALLEKKGGLDSVQVTGGESTLHPRFWDMVDWLHAQPTIKKVYVPTNGLTFASLEHGPEMVRRAARYRDKLMVLLQFDAVSKDANETLRNADPDRQRRRVVAALDAARVPMQLTMTISGGVNEQEIGGVLDLALKHDAVKVVALQPVTYSGRYELQPEPSERLTLSDIAEAVMRQSQKKVREGDFVPIPCSHPQCGWITVFLRRFGVVHNVVRYVDLEKAMAGVAYKTLMSTEEIQDVVGTKDDSVVRRVVAFVGKRLVRSTDMFSIAIKPFMDRFNYDQDRIANCCHHTTTTTGELVSFCEYNALDRPSDSWAGFPTRDGV